MICPCFFTPAILADQIGQITHFLFFGQALLLIGEKNNYAPIIKYVPGAGDLYQANQNVAQQDFSIFKTTSANALFGLGLSTCLGVLVGLCYGAIDKITYDELEARNWKNSGRFITWVISASVRSQMIEAIYLMLQLQTFSANLAITSMIARVVNWLIYFEKIKIPFIDLEQKKGKEKHKKISLQTDSDAVL